VAGASEAWTGGGGSGGGRTAGARSPHSVPCRGQAPGRAPRRWVRRPRAARGRRPRARGATGWECVRARLGSHLDVRPLGNCHVPGAAALPLELDECAQTFRRKASGTRGRGAPPAIHAPARTRGARAAQAQAQAHLGELVLRLRPFEEVAPEAEALLDRCLRRTCGGEGLGRGVQAPGLRAQAAGFDVLDAAASEGARR
jgi:hypothetical protein